MTLRAALVELLDSLPEDFPGGPAVMAVGLQVLARDLVAPEEDTDADPYDVAEDALREAWAAILHVALQFQGEGVTPPESVKQALALTGKALLTLQGGTR